MKLVKYCTGEEHKKPRSILIAIGVVFFFYLAGEATGEFLYNITH